MNDVPMDVVYPHHSREWWLQMENALNKLADTYSARSPMGRVWRALARWSGRRAATARPAGKGRAS